MPEPETATPQPAASAPPPTVPVAAPATSTGVLPGVGAFSATLDQLSRSKKQSSGFSAHLPLVLLVLDGWGVAPPSRGNAISIAKTPHLNRLMNEYPTVTLHASGEMVGLPWQEMGNSEVGHLNIGSGKIIYQNLPLIDKAIAEGQLAKNEVLLAALERAKQPGVKLHVMGMVSDGGIHSSQEHLNALLDLCKKQGLNEQVFVHAILDGRDTAKNAGLAAIARLEIRMLELGVGKIATLAGRHFTMDRDNRWERIEAAFNAMRWGRSDHRSDSPLKAIEQGYFNNVFDEQFPPTVITDPAGNALTTIDNGDVILFFNFRADRARQITKAFVLPGFAKFERGAKPEELTFVCMTEYEKNLPVQVAFRPDTVKEPVAKVVADAGFKQLHVAETEKYAHVTFFFNGGAEDEFENEDRVLIPSPRVKSYDETPAMSVQLVAERIAKEIQGGEYQFIVANFANADMVGHTGNLEAAIQAVEAADSAVGVVAEAVLAANGTLVVTADHGNAEQMVNLQSGEIIKEHSTNAVPCIMANGQLKAQREMWPPVLDGDISRMQPVGVLSDVAPTLLSLMGLKPPADMTSRSLIHL